MTSKKSKQHNVFEAEEQIWRTELVKFETNSSVALGSRNRSAVYWVRHT